MSWPRTCSQSIKVNFPQKIFLGSEYVITLPKSGDMITAIRLVLDLPAPNTYKEQIINNAEFLVGDTTLESISGDFLQILNNFTVSLENTQTFQNNLMGPLVTIDLPFSIVKKGFHMVTVPSLRLSLAQNQMTQDEIKGYLLVDYSLIEDAPKTTFIQRIVQNQNIRTIFTGGTFVKIDSGLVGPIFQLFFTAKVNGSFVDYIQNVKLVTDGLERFNLGKQYLKYVEPLKIFDSIPTDPILYYAFCLKSGSESSGSMNFSRLDTQRFEIELIPNIDEVQIDIWAQSHNFMYFNSSNVLPVFETRELLLSSAQEQTLSVLSDLPVNVSYRYYVNSISIFYHMENDVIVTPQVIGIHPPNSSIFYSPGVVTINNIFTDTYITLSFSAPGYNPVSCAISVNNLLVASSSSYSLTPAGLKSYSEVPSIEIKTNQTINIYADPGDPKYMNYNTSTVLNTGLNKSYYQNLADSFGMKNKVTSTVIDYDDTTFVAMMSNRNLYNLDLSTYETSPTGGCVVKYDTDTNVKWLVNLPGTDPLLGYSYPTLYGANQIQQFAPGYAVIQKLSCNYSMTLLLDNKGVVYYGGTNNYGEAGDFNTTNPSLTGFYVPKSLIGTNLVFVDVSCGEHHAALVDSNGGLWVVGRNTYGQLGLGDNTSRSGYSQVDLGTTRFTKVSCGTSHTVAVDSNGGLWVTGLNSSGQLGLGDNTNRNTFNQVTVGGGELVTKVSAGWNNTGFVTNLGNLRVTGANSSGQLGLGNTTPSNTFQTIGPKMQDVAYGYKCLMAMMAPNIYSTVSGYVSTGLSGPNGMCIDSAGNLFVPNYIDNTVTKVSSNGTQVTPAYIFTGLSDPTGACVDSDGYLFVVNYGDNTVTMASPPIYTVTPGYASTGLNGPYAICGDSANNMFVVNYFNDTVTKVSADGLTVTPGYVSTGLSQPAGICIDSTGNLFIANYSNDTVTKVSADGLTVTPGYVSVGLSHPAGICIDSTGNLFVTNVIGNTITKVSPDGAIVTPGYVNTGLLSPFAICIDSIGNLFVANFFNDTVTKVSADGLTVTPGYVNTGLLSPASICIDTVGNLYIANEANNTVTKVYSDGLHVVPGYVNTDLDIPAGIYINSSGVLFIANFTDSITKAIVQEPIVTPGYVSTGLSEPYGICIDSAGNLFVANFGNDTVTKVSADGLTVTPGYVSTGLSYPTSLFVDSSDNLFVTNMGNDTITMISSDGLTVTPGYVSTGLSSPSAICIDSTDNLFVVNYGNDTVTKVSADGLTVTPNVISTTLSGPYGICVDSYDNLYVANYNDNTISRGSLEGIFMAGGTWPTVRTSLTHVNTFGFNGRASFMSSSKSPSPTDADANDFWSTNSIIDNFGSLWVQGIGYSGQSGIQVEYGEPPNLATFNNITVGVYCLGPAPGSRTESTLNLPQLASINGGIAHSIAVDINGDLWVCGADRYINPVSATDSMGKFQPTPWGSFEYNRVSQQSTARSDTINFFTINNRDSGGIGTSVNVPALGTLTNITNDVNGKIYFNTVKNTSNSFPVLLSRTTAGLVTCVPPITSLKAGDPVQFSATSLISNGTIATVVPPNGFYMAVSPPVSAITNLPVIVTVGAVASQGCAYSADSTFNTKLIGISGTKCYSHVDRFDNYYIASVNSTTNVSKLNYKSWEISVSNSPCINCTVDVDFLNNIYFVGDYSATSSITGGGTFPITWSSNGGTFIMKLNQLGKIQWIIQITNDIPTQYPIISKLRMNAFTGAGYIAGYISSTQTGSVTCLVDTTTLSSPTYTITLPNIIQSQYISNGKYGFEFIFDPSGNLDPQIVSVPTNDFFQVPYKNLIGLHPVSTLPIPNFYPPQYIAWPPVSIINSTYELTPDALYSTSTLANASSGNGDYEVLTSSVYILEPSPGVFVPAAEASGIHAFDYRDYSTWTSSFGYSYLTGYYYYNSYLMTAAGPLFGEFIWIHFPSAMKAGYASIIESAGDYALDYTYLGSNDNDLWEPIFQATGDVTVNAEVIDINQLTYKVSDASKLYPGMTTISGTIKIVSVDHPNNTVVLSSSAYTESLTFMQVQNKDLYINSQYSYSYYAYSVQRKIPADANYYGWFSVYKLTYYEVKY